MKRGGKNETLVAIMIKLFKNFFGGPQLSYPHSYMYVYRTISYCNIIIIIIIIIIIDNELNARGACLYLNSKKSNGKKHKNLLGKNERIGL